jgi:hypothetical protein
MHEAGREHELTLRAAEAEHVASERARVIAMLLSRGDAVFASRRWRVGSALVDVAARVLRWFGSRTEPPQSARQWRDIVAAHEDALLRRRALLDQLCRADVEVDAVDLMHQAWTDIGAEHVVRDASGPEA